MSVLSQPTLVLNKHWRPIGIDTVAESIKKLMKDSCRFVDPETYEIYDMARWSQLEPQTDQAVVHSTRRAYVAPEVVLLTNYDDMPKNEIRLTRRNVLVRDRYECQYCGLKVARPSPGSKVRKLSDYTWDHLTPRSQGGKTTWTNIVTACFKCNSKKANKSLEQCGMKIIKMPTKPKWSLSLVTNVTRKPPSWDKFLTKEHWNAEHEFHV